ncbi:hypothetical protein Lesp02_26780 [Lentzea sp. NBRC 105346]|uniref:hypothetical protein n=1 Tax=Lentzea sp. NBRC 105346 TaxID=3032205 RepID=UPI002553694B|nr:hypothetical protein [Lentzea sp. NBRC 105346]GLZ30489.1 hypothetical protein Lesp02_26780 [Lentzea sp. NBRC 105346]
MRVISRTVLLAATGLLVLGATSMAQAGEASAALPCGQYWDADFNTNGVNIRSGPGVGFGVNGVGYIGHKIDICTSTRGDDVDCGNGRRHQTWDEIIDRRTGVRGFVSECFVNYQR